MANAEERSSSPIAAALDRTEADAGGDIRRLEMYRGICRAQQVYLQRSDAQVALQILLELLVEITGSRGGQMVHGDASWATGPQEGAVLKLVLREAMLTGGVARSGFVLALPIPSDSRAAAAVSGRAGGYADFDTAWLEPWQTACAALLRLTRPEAAAVLLSQQQMLFQKLALIAEHTDKSVILCGPDHLVQWTNAAFTRLFGYTAAEMVGRSAVAELLHGDNDRAVTRRLFDALVEQRPFAGELMGLDKERRMMWVEIEVETLEAGGEKLTAVFAVDITTRKLDEIRLRRQQELLERTGTIAKVGGWEYDVRNGKLLWSEQLYRIHEVEPDFELEVTRAILFYAPEARPVIERLVERAIEAGLPFDVDLPFVTAKGRAIWVRSIGEPVFENGVVRRLVGTFQDVTELWQVQQDLRAISDRLRVTLQAVDLGAWEWNPHTREFTWDATMYRLNGLEDGSPLDRQSVVHLVPEPDRIRLLSAMEPSYSDPFHLDITYMVMVDGKPRYLQNRGSLHRNDDGTPKLLAGVVRDVTPERRAEEAMAKMNQALREAKDRAETANRAKGDFLAVMSHEIRTPMNGILGMGRLLLEAPLGADERELCGMLVRSGEALLGIINDILDYSKIDSGKFELEDVDFELEPMLEETLELLQPRAAESGLVLALLLCPKVPVEIRGDPGRLRQIVLNLVGNAVKFTSSGYVSLTVDAPLPGRIRLVVTDTGIGIEPPQVHGIFDRFTQADSSTSRQFGGTGLGLAISGELVWRMGGRIYCCSEPGVGSSFGFTIQAEGKGTHPVQPVCGRCQVRLGEPRAAWLVTHMLELAGMEVVTEGDVEVVVFDDASYDEYGAGPAFARSRRIVLARERRPPEMGDVFLLHRPLKSRELRGALLGLQPAGSVAPSPLAVRVPQHAGLRVLLVEDNGVNQAVGRRMLERLGCVVAVAEDGVVALEWLQREPFALVFMDCQMPQMDGFEATRRIRAEERWRQIPVVALTAAAFPEDLSRCREAGMDDHLSKPISFESLTRMLDRWAPKRPGI